MRKIYTLFLLLTLFAAKSSIGQFNYRALNAVNTTSTYTDLGTTGTAIATSNTGGAITFDDDNSTVQNIGFNFVYNGTTFTQFILNTNGFIKLGNVAGARDNYNILDSLETNEIAAFNTDLDGGTNPEYRVATSGAAGALICKIQFKNLKDYSFTTGQFTNINFQIILYQGTNNIEFVYGAFTGSTATDALIPVVVGVKGLTSASSVNATKASVTTWDAATFIDGDYTANAFNVRRTVLPTAGRTYRFTASALPPVDAQVVAVYSLGRLPLSFGAQHVVSASIKNVGGAALTNISVTLNITGANTFTNVKMIASLAVDSSVIVSFNAFSPSVVGNDTVTVSVPADGNNTNNTSMYPQVITTNTYNYANSLTVNGSVGFNIGAGLLLSKFKLTGTGFVTNVNVAISNAASDTGNTVYGVVLNSLGVIVGQSAPYVIKTTDLNTYKSFAIPVPPSLSNTDFYVGLAQTANALAGYFPLSIQNEGPPVRTGAYYIAPLAGGISPIESTLGRFMIEAVVTSTLPLDFISFNGLIQGNTAMLKWVTANEVNNNLFEIERSEDGLTFNRVGTVMALNNTSATKSYQFADNSLNAILSKAIFYRLKQVDKDGSFKYSAIINLKLNRKTGFEIVVVNPSKNLVQLQISTNENEKISLQLVNVNGQLIAAKDVVLSAGTNSLTIGNNQKLSTGLYMLKIIRQNETTTKQVIIE